jgi:MSHA biogenesis protein MshP
MSRPIAPSASGRRRASAAVALLIVLAMLQIIVASIVFAGARSGDLTALRLDTARSFYAAEAGANLAIREVVLDSDVDGDGVIGSVSDDGDASNDPALGVARVWAEASGAGGTTNIVITGRSGQSARRITLSIESE